MATASELLYNWLHGTANGGPNGDGRYPLIGADGETYLIKCPAAQALDPSMDPSELEVFANTAVQAATEASAAAESASTSASNAASSASAASTSASNALSYRNTASTHATTATNKASEAASSATAAAGSASTASTANTNAQSAKTAAETARTKAQQWADNNEDVAVESGKFSAKHWAAKAAASAAALANIAWSAISGKPSINAGNGLTGGGLLDTSKTITLGTPSTLSGSTTNSVTTTSHTHALSANLSAWDGITPASKMDKSGDYFTGSCGYDTGVATVPRMRVVHSGDYMYLQSGLNHSNNVGKFRLSGWVGDSLAEVRIDANSVNVKGKEVWHSGTFNPSDYWNKNEALRYVGSPVDFDAITQPLAWGLSGTTGANRPEGYSAAVTLFDSGTYAIQLGAAYSGSNNYYIRSKHDIGGGYKQWASLWHSLNFTPSDYTPTSRSISAGNGLSGGGNFTANRTISLGTPGTLSGSTTNSVSSSSHTHALSANLSAWDGHNPSNAFVMKQAIGSSVDLNTILETGLYHQNSNANAGSGTNYPVGKAGWLEVFSYSAMVYQRYTEYNSGIIWTRSYYSGTWYPWTKVWDSGSFNPDAKLNTSSVDVNANNNTVAQRSGSGDLIARLFRSSFANQTSISGSAALAFRNNDSSDNYIRFISSDSAVRGWLGLGHLGSTSTNQINITTNFGVTSIGAGNSGYCHFNTDSPAFYMNKELQVNGEIKFYNSVRVPKTFVQSGDPGSSASTGDLWIW